MEFTSRQSVSPIIVVKEEILSDGAEMLANRLHELAHEGASDKRRQLLRELTDMFFEKPEGRSEAEAQLYGEVATQISGELSIKDRSDFAERIADEGKAPHGLVVSLGNDDISVARPILERSTVLTDADLCSIVEKRGEEHRVAVTARPAISERVSAALVQHGGEKVHTRLANHPNAAMALETRGQLCPAARPLNAQGPGNQAALAVSQALFNRVKRGQTTLDAELVELTQKGMTQVIGLLLSSLTGVKSEIAVRTVINGKAEALLMLLRAADASFESFELVLKMQARLLNRPEPDVEPHRQQYNAADLASAQRVIRFLNLRQAMELQGAA